VYNTFSGYACNLLAKRTHQLLSIWRIKDRLFYGWVVLAACLVVNAVIFGTRYSFGVFFKSLESEFGLTRAATSGVFSAYMVLCCIFAVLGGWALDRYGPRKVIFLMGIFTGLSLILTGQTHSPWQLFISYSLLLAVGTGAAYAVIMSTISRWFEKKRGFALGIAGSGVGLGTVIMAPLATYLITTFGWRTAFVVVGLIVGLIIVSLSMLLRKDPAAIGALPDGVKLEPGEALAQGNGDDTRPTSFSLLQALGTRNFWFFGGIWFLWSVCVHLVLTHIVPHATDVGISATEASFVLSLIGFILIPARLIGGGVSDRVGRKLSAIICASLQAGAMLWLLRSQELWMFYLFAVVYGFGYGGFDPPVVAMIGDIFGPRSLGVIMGSLVVGWSLGAAVGPIIGGYIFDVSGSYSWAFLMGALAMLVAGLLVALVSPGQRAKLDRELS